MRLFLTLSFFAIIISLAGCTKKSKEEQLKEVVEALPWVMEVLQYCEAYKQIEGEADKRDLATATARLVRNADPKNVRGKVEKVMPIPSAEDPKEYSLQIVVADKVRFATQSGERAIEKGDPLFDQVKGLEEDQCVLFSGKDLEAIATFQRGKICDTRYYTQFTNIMPCPQP